MIGVVQRVARASVSVDGKIVGEIERGLLVYVAAHQEDSEADCARFADRVVGLRIFNDVDGKMNLNLAQACETPAVLLISNFTLYGDSSKGRRPSFAASAPYARGEELFLRLIVEFQALGVQLATGEFGADMQVESINDGPVTLIVSTDRAVPSATR